MAPFSGHDVYWLTYICIYLLAIRYLANEFSLYLCLFYGLDQQRLATILTSPIHLDVTLRL